MLFYRTLCHQLVDGRAGGTASFGDVDLRQYLSSRDAPNMYGTPPSQSSSRTKIQQDMQLEREKLEVNPIHNGTMSLRDDSK